MVAFEAAARLLSFTKAAHELGVTQAAVSRQIKELEDFLSAALFVRGYRSVELTPAGLMLNAGLSVHIPGLASTCERVRTANWTAAIVVGMTSAFGTHWLTPRLSDFRRLHPNIELRLAVSDEIVDLSRQQIDISIRYGEGRWPRLRSEFLFGAEDGPVCSPGYHSRVPLPVTPATLANEQLIHLDGPPVFKGSRWKDWFAAHEIEPPSGKHQLTVNNFAMLIQATLGGQGIALAGYPLVSDLLAQGLLVPAVTQQPRRISGGYYVVQPDDAPEKSNVLTFRRWLQQEAASDAQSRNYGALLIPL